MRRNPVVSLLTDFGTRDAYVGAMKGVILRICPSATLIDISHKVSRHNILQGAFILSQAAPYFPEGSIHLAVVDPSVGTARRRIVVQGSRCFYVGPDNGVLSLAVKREGVVKAVEIRNEEFMLPRSSRTFEGRDVFAPVAAHLAKKSDIDDFGQEIRDLVNLSIAEPERRDGEFLGEVIHVDGFGNVTTNISREMLGQVAEGTYVGVTVGKVSKAIPFCMTYGEVDAKSPLLTLGSSGFLEVAVNQGSAEKLFKAKVGDRVKITGV